MELTKYVACICEGGAERTIIDILINNNKLIFNYEDLLENELIRIRSGEDFQKKYLRKQFSEPITIIRILDSHNENFKISKLYEDKVKVINIVTAPEIELLIIIKENKYKEYSKVKSTQKPSEFCKNVLGYKNVKKENFIREYFYNIDDLIDSIREYKRLSRTNKNEYTLADLLI